MKKVEKPIFATVAVSFVIIDFNKLHSYHHFDPSKTSAEHKKRVDEIINILGGIKAALHTNTAVCHGKGAELGEDYYPATCIRVLIDVSSHSQNVRYYALLQAIANLNYEHLTDFQYCLLKYDPQALYRQDFRW